MSKEKQIKRITEMENLLDDALDALSSLSRALDKYEKAAPGIKKLVRYYGSGSWMRDVSDDASANLPAELKRGVLSEDAVYDLICDNREVCARALAVVSKTLRDHTI